MRGDARLIRNFPPGVSRAWKAYANLVYHLGRIRLTWRPNLLGEDERQALRQLARRGDLLLFGNLHNLGHLFLGHTVTHGTLYLGGGRLIHAMGHGVRENDLEEALAEYDTVALLRLPAVPRRDAIIEAAVAFAEARRGRPFDFACDGGDEAWFCSKFLNEAYRAAGHETGLQSQRSGSLWGRYLEPPDFLGGAFDLVFLSRHLTRRGGRLRYLAEPPRPRARPAD